jgi:hypothetical protein
MQKLFLGTQSGVFSYTWRLINEARPGLPVHAWVEGTYASTGQPLATALHGFCVDATLQGYVRNLVVASTNGTRYTVGCEHAVEEDICAHYVRMVYYPELSFAEVADRLSTCSDDGALLTTLVDGIVALDNTDPEQIEILSGLLARYSDLANHPSEAVRWHILILAKQVNELSQFGEVILQGIKDPSTKVREAALVDLAAYASLLANVPVEEHLLQAVNSAQPNVRIYATEDLGFYGTQHSAAALTQLLLDPHEHVREATFITLHRLLEAGRFELNQPAQDRALIACYRALEERDRYVLQAAALRLGLLLDPLNERLVNTVLTGIRKPLDLTVEEPLFRARIFYHGTLMALLAKHGQGFTHRKALRSLYRDAVNAVAEELRQLYQRDRLRYWSSYLRTYIEPPAKRPGQVFVNFAHASTAFCVVIEELKPELAEAGIHLFISKNANPFWSENVFIPKVFRPIQQSELMVADISLNNLNVGYELGLADKFNLPVVLVVSNRAQASVFDLIGHYVHFVYDVDDMSPFKEALADHLKQALGDVVSWMEHI